VEEGLKHYLRAAYRDDLGARRDVLQRLRQLGHGSLSAVLARAFAPDVVHLDGWALAQIGAVEPLTEEDLDDLMPWRSAAAACRCIAQALKEHTGRSWHVRASGPPLALLRVGPPKGRLLPGGELTEEDRRVLAERFGRRATSIKSPALTFEATAAGLRECLARAEGREYVSAPEEQGG
jgi:hypothetical protein